MSEGAQLIYLSLVGLGLVGGVGLFVFALRRAGQNEKTWQAAARANGWLFRSATESDLGFVLQGRTGELTWTCRLYTGPVRPSWWRATRDIRRLETVWSARLPSALKLEEIDIHDKVQAQALQLMASPLLTLGGFGGRAMRAGIKEIEEGIRTRLGDGHIALSATDSAARPFLDEKWQAALVAFAKSCGGRQHRLRLAQGQLEIALLGAISDAKALKIFITEASSLGEATLERLRAVQD